MISVVILSYNYGKVISRAISSVVAQCGNFTEMVIVDDGSTDSSPCLINCFAAQNPSLIRAFFKSNGGPASARNLAITETCFDHILFLDADDELAPGALEVIDTYLRNYPNADLLIGEHLAVNPCGTSKRHRNEPLSAEKKRRVIDYALDKKLSLVNGACVMSRKIFSKGLYPEHFRGAEDIPVFMQALANFEAVLIPEVLLINHKHSTSLRHNFAIAKKVGDQLISEVFDTGRLPPDYEDLRSRFAARRFLSLFRTAVNARALPDARDFFWKAVQYDLLAVLREGYLLKYLRTFFLKAKPEK